MQEYRIKNIYRRKDVEKVEEKLKMLGLLFLDSK